MIRHNVLFVVAVLGAALIAVEDAATSANVFLLTATAASGLFVAVYVCRSRWRRTAPGRALVYMASAFFIFGCQVSLSLWLGTEYWGRGVIRLALYLGLSLTLTNLVLILLEIQGSQRRRGASEEPDERA